MGLSPQPSARGKLDDWLNERANMNELIRPQLVRSHVRMKK
jgi:hypothetical protein